MSKVHISFKGVPSFPIPPWIITVPYESGEGMSGIVFSGSGGA
jgi:hypothetical protein